MKRIILIICFILITASSQVYAVECDSSTQCAYLGTQFINQKEYKNAIECFDKAISFDEKDYFSYAFRAKSYYYLKDYSNVVKDIEKSLSIKPNSVAYGLRATMELKEGKHRESIEDATKALELNPNYMKCYEVRGRAEIATEDYFGALKDATKAIKLRDNYAKSYEVKAMAYMGLKDYQSSLENYEKASELFKEVGDRKNYKKMKKQAKLCRKRIRQ